MHKEAGSFQSIKSPWGRVKLRQRAERGTAPGDWLGSVPRRHFPAAFAPETIPDNLLFKCQWLKESEPKDLRGFKANLSLLRKSSNY